MGWHFWGALADGLVAASLIDWLFADALFDDRYLRHPEMWRTPGDNTRGIIVAPVPTIPTVAYMFALLHVTGAATVGPATRATT